MSPTAGALQGKRSPHRARARAPAHSHPRPRGPTSTYLPICPRGAAEQACQNENHEFTTRIFERSGISPTGTYLPPWINPVHVKEPRYDMDAAKREAEMVMGGAVADLLQKTGAPRPAGGGGGGGGSRCGNQQPGGRHRKRAAPGRGSGA